MPASRSQNKSAHDKEDSSPAIFAHFLIWVNDVDRRAFSAAAIAERIKLAISDLYCDTSVVARRLHYYKSKSSDDYQNNSFETYGNIREFFVSVLYRERGTSNSCEDDVRQHWNIE